jgi:hypothetical protein
MADNLIRKSGADANTVATGKKSGFTIDPGPYEATVMKHVQGTRMGQIEVYIPEISGVSPELSSPITVSYASPFYGTTYGTDTQQLADSSMTSGQSYGMWMVPPDIGCKVLVTFAAGDRSRGYWFACIYDSTSHHMVPGVGRAVGGKDKTLTPNEQIKVDGNSNLPVVEYSTKSDTAFQADGIVNTPRRPHEYQASILVRQGLDRDKIRGAISSSSLRESPSNVYGISTPGRKITATDQVAGKPQAVIARKGGHQFVMDDGAEDGTDQLVRLRTSGGHQILMNDTEQVLYIASASGNHWLEFSNNGQINMYSIGGFNLRTGGVMNLHSDVALNMSAPNIKISACGNDKVPLGAIKMETSGNFSASAVGMASLKCNGQLSLSAIGKASLVAGGLLDLSSAVKTSVFGGVLLLNSGKPGIPMPVLPPTTKFLTDTTLQGTAWATGGVISTGCTVAPAHEPWLDADGKRPKK